MLKYKVLNPRELSFMLISQRPMTVWKNSSDKADRSWWWASTAEREKKYSEVKILQKIPGKSK